MARAKGRTAELPELASKRETVAITRAVLLVRDGDRVLLRRRPAGELMAGLWDQPGAFEGDDSVAVTTVEEVVARLPFRVEVGRADRDGAACGDASAGAAGGPRRVAAWSSEGSGHTGRG